MKKIIQLAAFATGMMVLLNACTPDNDFTIGDPANRVQQLGGTWKLVSVTQTDLLAQGNNFNDPARPDVNLIKQDVTAAAPFTDIRLTLNQSGGAASTYTVDYGAGPHIFGAAAGNWSVDNVKAPGQIRFVVGTDTVKTQLGGLNTLVNGMLTLQKTRYQGVKPVILYNYIFNK